MIDPDRIRVRCEAVNDGQMGACMSSIMHLIPRNEYKYLGLGIDIETYDDENDRSRIIFVLADGYEPKAIKEKSLEASGLPTIS